MQDYFIWNGTDCRDYGIHVTEQPPITIPSERSTQTNVPGRPGSLTQLEGEDVYDDLLLTATCFISDPTQIPAIATWLKGAGTVTFANRTGGYYKARIANQISFEKVLRGNPHCTFAVNFRCYPFFYADAAADITVTTSGTIITNPGSVYSEPILTGGTGEHLWEHRYRLRAAGSIPRNHTDERSHERRVPGTEARCECHIMDGYGHEGGRQAELALPLSSSKCFCKENFANPIDKCTWQ